MNKSDLVDQVATNAGISKAAAARAIDSFVDGVTASLKAGEHVALIGFGTFKVTTRAARVGRNPRTGAALKIAARKVPGFTAGKTLKDAVN